MAQFWSGIEKGKRWDMKKETNDLVSSKRDVFGISGGLWSPNNIIQKTAERAGFFLFLLRLYDGTGLGAYMLTYMLLLTALLYTVDDV